MLDIFQWSKFFRSLRTKHPKETTTSTTLPPIIMEGQNLSLQYSGQIIIFHQSRFPFFHSPSLASELEVCKSRTKRKVKQTQEAFLATPQCASEWHPEIGTTPCSTKNWSTICKRSVWIRIRTHRNLQL